MLAETPRSARPALNLATSVISTQWHATFNLPTKIAEPNKITAFTYANANATTGMGAGNLTGRSETQTTDSTGAAKFTATQAANTAIGSTGWSYSSNGLTTSVVEKKDTTVYNNFTFTYDALGVIKSTKNVLSNKTTTVTQADSSGRVLRQKEADGTEIVNTYDSRGILKQVKIGTTVATVTSSLSGMPLSVDVGGSSIQAKNNGVRHD